MCPRPMFSVIWLLSTDFDSAEPFDPEPLGRELRVDRLTADGLVAGCYLNLDIPKPKILNLVKVRLYFFSAGYDLSVSG